MYLKEEGLELQTFSRTLLCFSVSNTNLLNPSRTRRSLNNQLLKVSP